MKLPQGDIPDKSLDLGNISIINPCLYTWNIESSLNIGNLGRLRKFPYMYQGYPFNGEATDSLFWDYIEGPNIVEVHIS